MLESGRYRFLFLLVILVVCANPAYTQFSYNKIEDDFEFEFQKTVEFYTNPRYNRVEGVFGHGGLKYNPKFIDGFIAHAEVGWGFSNETGKKFRFHAGIRKDFMGFDRLSIGVDAFKQLDSEDNWIVGDIENSIFSFIFREDYKDYYGVHGLRFYVDKKIAEDHTLRLELSRRTYDSLQRNINWSVFKGDFQKNPALAGTVSSTGDTLGIIAEGDELGIKLIGVLDWRDNSIFPQNGWFIEGIYEHTADDFKTDGLFLSFKHYRQTFGRQRLLLSAKIGSRSGSLAEQYTVDLGGIGSLRAYDDKEFHGNRVLLLNANYLFGGDILQKFPLHGIPVFGGFWNTLSLGLFVDAGWAGLTAKSDGLFSGFDDIKLKTDIGISVMVLEGVFRMDVARRMNSASGKDDYRITFRILDTL